MELVEGTCDAGLVAHEHGGRLGAGRAGARLADDPGDRIGAGSRWEFGFGFEGGSSRVSFRSVDANAVLGSESRFNISSDCQVGCAHRLQFILILTDGRPALAKSFPSPGAAILNERRGICLFLGRRQLNNDE